MKAWTSCLRAANARSLTAVPRRTLVYTKDGSLRARGLKKEETDYLTSSNGTTYPGDEATLQPIKKLLGDLELPEKTLLQVLTHKSFAHGKRPFNERLANLGRDFLRLSTTQFAVGPPTSNPHSTNGHNFDIEQRALDLLSSTTVLAQIARRNGLANSIFWRNPHPNQTPERSGENTVCAKSIDALVGAVLLVHGEDQAAQFVKKHLIDDLVTISGEVIEQKTRSEIPKSH